MRWSSLAGALAVLAIPGLAAGPAGAQGEPQLPREGGTALPPATGGFALTLTSAGEGLFPLPEGLLTRDVWTERFEDINAYERHLARNGTKILKFFLHVSRDEQRRRFLERLEDPTKNWKFSLADLGERDRWDEYMAAYEDMIRRTATAHAPWYVVPADHKWFTRLVVGEVIVDALERLNPTFPSVPASERQALAAARASLKAEGKGNEA